MVTRVTPKGAQKSVKSGVERVVVILCVGRYHQTPCTALQNGRVAEWPIGLTAGHNLQNTDEVMIDGNTHVTLLVSGIATPATIH